MVMSRRRFLQRAVAGALVLGFDTRSRSWITRALAAGDIADLPRLDGELRTTSVEPFAADFGRIVSRQPRAVLIKGFEQTDRFLRSEGFHHPKFLPYRTQLTPLAAVLAHLGERWLEPQIKTKIARWFRCGVFGELYGGAVETRIALDVQQLLGWIGGTSSQGARHRSSSGLQPEPPRHAPFAHQRRLPWPLRVAAA